MVLASYVLCSYSYLLILHKWFQALIRRDLLETDTPLLVAPCLGEQTIASGTEHIAELVVVSGHNKVGDMGLAQLASMVLQRQHYVFEILVRF
jgi:hypothetical protein